ncbi:Protein of unknown function [Pyronema omphalodes CBS 100304]|uniref:Uncharacterized protein n=1 Tax=Pyronema omphalodes (strain CBS 100304) TaxID=1076935 RepID=U4LGQ0_PYROM|nr:Protein of unknown function [Pyronema omphalodes CBS 100304]
MLFRIAIPVYDRVHLLSRGSVFQFNRERFVNKAVSMCRIPKDLQNRRIIDEISNLVWRASAPSCK